MVFPDVSGCEWSNDSKKVVYTTHDDKNRPNKVHCLTSNLTNYSISVI